MDYIKAYMIDIDLTRPKTVYRNQTHIMQCSDDQDFISEERVNKHIFLHVYRFLQYGCTKQSNIYNIHNLYYLVYYIRMDCMLLLTTMDAFFVFKIVFLTRTYNNFANNYNLQDFTNFVTEQRLNKSRKITNPLILTKRYKNVLESKKKKSIQIIQFSILQYITT